MTFEDEQLKEDEVELKSSNADVIKASEEHSSSRGCRSQGKNPFIDWFQQFQDVLQGIQHQPIATIFLFFAIFVSSANAVIYLVVAPVAIFCIFCSIIQASNSRLTGQARKKFSWRRIGLVIQGFIGLSMCIWLPHLFARYSLAIVSACLAEKLDMRECLEESKMLTEGRILETSRYILGGIACSIAMVLLLVPPLMLIGANFQLLDEQSMVFVMVTVMFLLLAPAYTMQTNLYHRFKSDSHDRFGD